MEKNVYPQKFIDKSIQKFLNKIFIQTPQIPFVPKRELITKMSQIIKTKLTKTMTKHMKFCKIKNYLSY